MNDMRKLMEAVKGLSGGVRVNYDGWKTSVPKNLNSRHIAILQLMSDGQSRERTDMIRSATKQDPNPRSSGGFAGWNKLDYDLYKKGLLDVVDIRGGRKIFQINAAGQKALKLSEGSDTISEAATSDQWEIAINNLIADGDNRYAIAGATIEEKNVWNWVRSELHGMLDFQPDN